MGPLLAGAILAGGLAVGGVVLGSVGVSSMVDQAHERVAASSANTDPSSDPDGNTPSDHPAPPSGATEEDPEDPQTTTPAPGDAPGADGSPGEDTDPGSSDDEGTSDENESRDQPDGTDAEGVAYFTRKLVWGDTLWDISQATGISVERLAAYNSIPDPDLIYAGDDLQIPER